MFSEVLVGVDGAEGGRDAIALAKQLAHPDAKIALAHVYGAGLMPGAGAALLLAAELEESERLLERARRVAAPRAQVITSADHSIGRGLHLIAEEEGFDLIAIGASQHGFLGRVLIGNDAIATVNDAPCPVAIAPYGYARNPRPLSSLGVGFDGTPEAGRALAAARHLAARDGSSIQAVVVLPLQSRPYGGPAGHRWADIAEQLPEEDRRRFYDLTDIDAEVRYGNPDEELERFSEAIDLLIVGSGKYGPVRRILHDSVSRNLVRHSACPLLVLVGGAAEATAADDADRARASSAMRG
jgi:nucleotide-binding universal stress UspA family protein